MYPTTLMAYRNQVLPYHHPFATGDLDSYYDINSCIHRPPGRHSRAPEFGDDLIRTAPALCRPNRRPIDRREDNMAISADSGTRRWARLPARWASFGSGSSRSGRSPFLRDKRPKFAGDLAVRSRSDRCRSASRQRSRLRCTIGAARRANGQPVVGYRRSAGGGPLRRTGLRPGRGAQGLHDAAARRRPQAGAARRRQHLGQDRRGRPARRRSRCALRQGQRLGHGGDRAARPAGGPARHAEAAASARHAV